MTLARQVENAFAGGNISGGEEIIREEVRNAQDIKYAILMEASGKAKLHTLQPELEQTILQAARDQKALAQKDLTVMAEFTDQPITVRGGPEETVSVGSAR